MTATETRTDIVERTLDAYRSFGYDIVLRPDGAEHGWHTDFHPDFLARHRHETVVVAVLSRRSIGGEAVTVARDQIDRRPDWRMHFVFIEDPDAAPLKPLRPVREELRPQLAEAAAVLALNDVAGLLLAAAILEAHLREACLRHGERVTSTSHHVPSVASIGASLGYVTDADLVKSRSAWDTYERVARGFLPDPGDPSPRAAAELYLRMAAHVSDELDDGTD